MSETKTVTVERYDLENVSNTPYVTDYQLRPTHGGDWVRYDDHLTALAAAEQRIAELEQCAAFVQWVRQEWHHDGDIDGGALQDALTERGLLTPTEVHAPCDPEACQCAEYGEFPVVCYRWADAARQEAAP